ncbi:unnamed protein product [Rhizophagus irregularis]|nr:unnamed protein product [Rhizophagus irregularis]CAB5315400.1 unnamed protein product [Rhizophagus irregularis]
MSTKNNNNNTGDYQNLELNESTTMKITILFKNFIKKTRAVQLLDYQNLKFPKILKEIQKEDQSKKTRYYNTIARFATIAHPNLNRGEILADDMGLGKTIQMIALIASKPAINLDSTYSKTTLIATPLSVLDNWVDQINIHVKKGSLSYYVFHGINRNNDPEFLKDHDIIITTYAILAQSDIKERNGLLAIKWLRVILDE